MTAHAVTSSSAVPVTSNGAAKSAPQDPTAKPFEHQLHAARQQRSTDAQEHTPAHETHPQRGPDPGRDQRRDPSPLGPHARHLAADAGKSEKTQVAKPIETAAATVATTLVTASLPAATLAVAAVASVAAPVEAAVVAATTNETAPTEASAEGSEQGAAALVGAMLAMIGPVVGKVLAPGATSSPVARPVAGDRGAAALLSVADAASGATNAVPASTPMVAPLLAADSLKAEFTDLRVAAAPDSASALALAVTLPASTSAPSVPVSVPLASAAGTHAFAQELGQQVAWFVGHDIKQARIRLHPEELGSLDLKISVSHGRVDVSFQAQHPGAITALQQSLPQLGQMLAQHGLSLGHAEVGQQHDRGDHRGQSGSDRDGPEMAEIHGASQVTPLGQIGLLDAFA